MAAGRKFFSSVDIHDAYYMISVAPADSDKLTITTPIGNFRWRYLTMVLMSSSTYFLHLINKVLLGIPLVFAYLYNVMVMTKDLDKHYQILRLVFERF